MDSIDTITVSHYHYGMRFAPYIIISLPLHEFMLHPSIYRFPISPTMWFKTRKLRALLAILVALCLVLQFQRLIVPTGRTKDVQDNLRDRNVVNNTIYDERGRAEADRAILHVFQYGARSRTATTTQFNIVCVSLFLHVQMHHPELLENTICSMAGLTTGQSDAVNGMVKQYAAFFHLTPKDVDSMITYFGIWDRLRQCCGMQMIDLNSLEAQFMSNELYKFLNNYKLMKRMNRPAMVDGDLDGSYCSRYNDAVRKHGNTSKKRFPGLNTIYPGVNHNWVEGSTNPFYKRQEKNPTHGQSPTQLSGVLQEDAWPADTQGLAGVDFSSSCFVPRLWRTGNFHPPL
ncbi:hypothetical protein HJC23_004347 [Cyclotella cryptica]|uniref:Uncharacterized protein n=1 Tax=Cyclotella cryptica TaxID=29204 RepID=A0ABD3NWY0_9STRA